MPELGIVSDFDWVDTTEPHARRRQQILAKYPDIKHLFGHEPRTALIVISVVLAQILVAYLLRDAPWAIIFVLAYVFGGTVNHSLLLSLHEIAHNLAFGNLHIMANRLLGFIGNLPIGIPMSISFKRYHIDHHRYMGDSNMDMDIPSDLEAKLVTNTFTKLLWMLLQPCVYSIRPLLKNPKSLALLEVVNFIIQLTFDGVIFYMWGAKSLIYLLSGTFLATGLHPMAGHFISEHYIWSKGYETFSYYGPLNYLTFNVGYHTEHHDFPNIPWSNLPKVRQVAPEFYDSLPHHTSWVKVIWDFITDPSIHLYSRVKRRRDPDKPREKGE